MKKRIRKAFLGHIQFLFLVLVCVYLVCKENGLDKTFEDIANKMITDTSNVKPNEIRRLYRLVVTELDLKFPVADSVIKIIADSVVKLANKLNLSHETKSQVETKILLLKRYLERRKSQLENRLKFSVLSLQPS